MEKIDRRKFLGSTTIAAGGALLGTREGATATPTRFATQDGIGVALLADPNDETAALPPAQWAIEQVRAALAMRGATVRRIERLDQARKGETVIVAAGTRSAVARGVLERAGMAVPAGSEALALARGKVGDRLILAACGSDARGLAYALLELADRVDYGDSVQAALDIRKPVHDRPANAVRSIARIFSSEIEDKPWFYDRKFWDSYLSMLAAQRFNRFSLMLGMAYDFLNDVTDAYLHFAYPFLVSVPGHDVRVVGLPDGERERNLEMVRFVGEEANRRGLDFHLGIWTHGYDWSGNPGVNYTISGLTPETNAVYCRDALRTLLQQCPAIQGVDFRIHGESGIAEASYTFWKTVFEGVRECGRIVEMNLHTKGLDQPLLDTAIATGMPVTVSPKYWAEHQGLPYQQASIRALELPPRDQQDQGFFSKSDGSRRFLRYGYGDLLTEGRSYGVYYRVWPGTQRLLLWGDPVFAAGYSRAGAFCGSQGMEWCEPLSFKGRKGSGLPGGRDAYAYRSLRPTGYDFEKYRYTYTLLGRLLYNPSEPPQTWRRLLKREYGDAAGACESALAQASRILPLVTTAHLPSAANNGFWPEIYTNMPIVSEKLPHPYGDTPSPKRFGTVSPLDPALFSTIEEFTESLLGDGRDARYSPIDVAQWLDDLAAGAEKRLAEALIAASPSRAIRRLGVDVTIQARLGRFFAQKLRAGALFELYRLTGDARALREAIAAYRVALEVWSYLAALGHEIYVSDITFGRAAHLRGSWQDRLKAIGQDLADMEAEAAHKTGGADVRYTPERIGSAIRHILARSARPRITVAHTPPPAFRRGDRVVITAYLLSAKSVSPDTMALRYRHVNQAEPYRVLEMKRQGSRFEAIVPGSETDSAFPLQYFFELQRANGDTCLYPGFNADLSNQPYLVIRQAR